MKQLKLIKIPTVLQFTDGTLYGRDKGLFALCDQLAKSHSNVLVITDQNIASLYGSLFEGLFSMQKSRCEKLVIPAGENAKSLLTANVCWTKMSSLNLDRKSCVIGFGGGVVSDLAGFTAACFMRGIPYVLVPTTLLAMVDAAIGGKTGVNLLEGKNLIGAFHHPKQVFLCPSFLETLPEREFRSGLAEVIKYGVILDPKLFEFLEANMPLILKRDKASVGELIFRCCQLKAGIVEQDPDDSLGIRAILNWGHTFAHAIESATGYEQFLHGEAVAIGMSLAARVSVKLGYAPPDFLTRQDNLLLRAGFDLRWPNISRTQLFTLLKKDKKNTSGKIGLIVGEKIGKVFKLPEVEMAIIEDAILEKARTDDERN